MPDGRRDLSAVLRLRTAQHGDKLRFLVVGSIGFVVDGGILLLLEGLAGWPPLAARLLSFPIAATATWLLNRTWTFKEGRALPPRRQYTLYLLIQLAGGALNFSAFVALIQIPVFRAWPIAALAIASVAAMSVTYILSRRIVFAATKLPNA